MINKHYLRIDLITTNGQKSLKLNKETAGDVFRDGFFTISNPV